MPHNAEDYVHRIGRTGRAGRKGVAITIATPHDARAVQEIEALIGRKIELGSLEGVKTLEFAAEDEAAGKRRRNRKPKAKPKAKPQAQSETKPASDEKGKPRNDTSGAGKESRKAGKPAKSQKPASAAAGDGGAKARPLHEPSPAARSGSGEGRGRRSRDARDDEPVLGLGDHVPAFLTRSPKR
ncbi:MAG: hypothetical protein Kow00104_08750 [Rhodothalassiaceae bacterium]